MSESEDRFDCQEFHELCLDYRGALARDAKYAYERLQAYCRASSPPASEQERTPEQLARDLQTNQEIDAMVREMKQPSDEQIGRACILAWDLSKYAAGAGDAVHPMYSTAFFAGARAVLALHAEPVEKMKGEGA